VFLASSIVWMATPLHKKEYLSHETSEEVADWMRRNKPARGRYMVGWCQPGKDEETPTLTATSPRGLLLVDYGPVSMGKNLGAWFFHLLIVSLLVGYVASVSLAKGAASVDVFRLTSTAAFLAHGGGALPKAIWEGVPWSHVPAAVVDALIYAAVTGAVFCWLWP
jgi:hypothetical protein